MEKAVAVGDFPGLADSRLDFRGRVQGWVDDGVGGGFQVVAAAGQAQGFGGPEVKGGAQAGGFLLELGAQGGGILDFGRGAVGDGGQGALQLGGTLHSGGDWQAGKGGAVVAAHYFGGGDANEGVAAFQVAAQPGKGQAGDKGGEPQGNIGDFHGHGGNIDAVDAAFEDEAAEEVGGFRRADGRLGGFGKELELFGDAGQAADFGQETGDAVGHQIQGGGKEVGAAHSRVDDGEVKEAVEGGGRLAAGQGGNFLQVGFQGGEQGVVQQVADEFLAGVIDAAGFAAAGLGLVVELGAGYGRSFAGPAGAETVAFGVIDQILPGSGQAQAEQGFVDGPQVAHLQAGVVQAGGVGFIGFVGDGGQGRGQVGIGDGGLFQEFAAGKAGGGEQAAVVSRDAGGSVAVADHSHQGAEGIPAAGGFPVETARRHSAGVGQVAGAVGPVSRRIHRQIAPGLGMQQENKAENQGQGGFFDAPPLLPVVQVNALLFQVFAQALGQIRQGLGNQALLQAAAQFLAEVLGLGNAAGQQAVALQGSRGQQAQVKAVGGQQFGGIQFQIVAGGGSGRRPVLKNPQAGAGGQEGPRSAITAAVGQGQPFGKFAISVQLAEPSGVVEGMYHGQGGGVRAAQQVALPRQFLDAVAQVLKQGAPGEGGPGVRQGGDGLAQRLAIFRPAQPLPNKMGGEQVFDPQARNDAFL